MSYLAGAPPVTHGVTFQGSLLPNPVNKSKSLTGVHKTSAPDRQIVKWHLVVSKYILFRILTLLTFSEFS